jgi:hypothetical protein
MDVKVIPGNDSHAMAGRDYVRVSTCNDPLDDTVTLATIERVVEKEIREASAPAVHIKTLIQSQPMSPDAAIGLATCYAERKHIPVVYMNKLVPTSD